MATFRDLLKQSTDAVERPVPLATGHYTGVIKNFEFGASSKKQTPFLRILLVPEAPEDDVDADELNGVDLAKKELRKEYYITPTALYRLSDMLDAVLGKQQGLSFDERIPDLRGTRVVFGVTKSPSNQNENEFFNDVTTVIAAE